MQASRSFLCLSVQSSQSAFTPLSKATSIPTRLLRTTLSNQQRPITMASATTFYDFKPKNKKGDPYDFSQLKGQVVLVVNTASKCGFTPQFEGLEALYKKLKASHPDNFTIIGFPCNQFGKQDPGSDEEIQSFCQINYGVSFPVLGKTNVNPVNKNTPEDPVFQWLKPQKGGFLWMTRVFWNFEKFLISREGKVVGRWTSFKKPQNLEKVILAELAKGEPVKKAVPAAETTPADTKPVEDAKPAEDTKPTEDSAAAEDTKPVEAAKL